MKKKAQVRTDRRSRKSRSVEEIGFGLTRRKRKDEGEEEDSREAGERSHNGDKWECGTTGNDRG